MNINEKMLKLLFGNGTNRLRKVTGIKKGIIDYLIGRTAMRKTFGLLRQNRASLSTWINVIDNLRILASENKQNFKYVYFNDHVYVDCFAPKWPGKAFDRFFESQVQNLLREEKKTALFIPTLVFSITKKCVYRCEHCYAIQSLGKKDVLSYEQLLQIAKDFQKIGVAVIAWEGGEPLLRFEELLSLIENTNDQSESMIATTAHGLTDEKAKRLREAGLGMAIISLDHYDPDKHNQFRGNKRSFEMAVNGVRIFRENGILPSIAICATREIMEQDGLYEYLELAKDIGVAFIQILDATPSGNYLGKDVALTNKQLREIIRFHKEVNSSPRYRDYPSIQARALLEDESSFGCCGGYALSYVDNSGNFQACDLLQISCGNVLEEGVQGVYDRMKDYFPHPTKGRCPAQTLHMDIKKVYDEVQTLPLPYQKCEHILQNIQERGLPDLLANLSDRRKRKRLQDYNPF